MSMWGGDVVGPPGQLGPQGEMGLQGEKGLPGRAGPPARKSDSQIQGQYQTLTYLVSGQ
jgi:hypothetical protein